MTTASSSPPNNSTAGVLFLPAHSNPDDWLIVFQYFLSQKVVLSFTLTFSLHKCLLLSHTPLPSPFFRLPFLSPGRQIAVLKEGVWPSSWAVVEANTMAGCSHKLSSSHWFSTALPCYLCTSLISCFVLFQGETLKSLQKFSCNKFFVFLLITQELSGTDDLGLYKILYFQSCCFPLAIPNTGFLSSWVSLDSFTALISSPLVLFNLIAFNLSVLFMSA